MSVAQKEENQIQHLRSKLGQNSEEATGQVQAESILIQVNITY